MFYIRCIIVVLFIFFFKKKLNQRWLYYFCQDNVYSFKCVDFIVGLDQGSGYFRMVVVIGKYQISEIRL